MAFSSGQHINVRTDGHDTNCGGGFDPGLSGITFATDLTATNANTSSPTVSSSSYSFVSGDVGAWLYIAAGTNWYPGWYQISSVSSGSATINATAGEWIRANSGGGGLGQLTGCASVASPSGGSWSVDYSKQASAQWSYTDLAIDGTTDTDITSSTYPFGVNHVGNVISITAGTGFTVQRVGIVSIQSGNTARCDKAVGTAGSTGGTGYLGGAMASPGGAGSWHVSGGRIHIKSGTYTINSTTANVSGGKLAPAGSPTAASPCTIIGYETRPYDMAARPVLKASGISGTHGLIQVSTNNNLIHSIAFDGNSCSGIHAFYLTAGSREGLYDCVAYNFVAAAYRTGNATMYIVRCYASGTGYGFDGASVAVNCVAEGCSVGFAYCKNCIGCIADSCTTGFTDDGGGTRVNCTAYGCTTGFSLTGSDVMINCLSVGNSGYGYYVSSSGLFGTLLNCADYNNSSGRTQSPSQFVDINPITLTANPFTNASGDDFSLNNTAGGGAACRNAGWPGAFPGNDGSYFATTGYADIGAVQHQDSGGGGTTALLAGMPVSAIGVEVL